MAKKLLSEAQVRRFAKLANLSPINEMYSKRDDEEEKMEEAAHAEEEKVEEGMYAEDEPAADEEMPPMEDEPADEEPEMDMGAGDELELTDEEAMAIIELGKKLEAAMPEGGDEEPEMDMGGDDMPPMEDEPEMDLNEEEAEEEIMEALQGITYVPERKEIVEEVARRVAKRLLKAKRAESALKEALGNTKTKK